MNARIPPDVWHVLLAAVVSFAIAITVMGLWDADLRTPLNPHSDGLLHAAMIRGTLDDGNPRVIERVGEPGDLDFRDFPATDNLSLLLIRGLSLAIRDAGLLLNVYFLLTFPLVTASAFLVTRRLGLTIVSSWVVAILYAMLPYHFMRSVGHLFLSAYFMVPPAILVALWLSRGEPLFQRREPGFRPGLTIAAITLSLILGCCGVYYPFFACAIFVIAGVTGCAVRRTWWPALNAAIVIALVFGTVGANLAPSILKERSEGKLSVAKRVAAESELYGLKVTQLILPIRDHRIDAWNRLRQEYQSFPLVNENELASLGVVGSAGFLVLLAWLLFGKPQPPAMNWGFGLLNHLSVLNLWAVLVGTIGGFSSIFALLVSPRIRSYNRISVFIAFFALVAVGVLLDRLSTGWRRGAVVAVAALLIVLGTLDQTSPSYQHFHGNPYPATTATFVRQIRTLVPPNSAIFQLPYFPFPENGPILEIGDYEHFRPYIQSTDLRFSYGAVKGSAADLWQKEIASSPPDQLARKLALAGFAGVWIDRRGFPDRGAEIEASFASQTGANPIVSPTDDQSFFPLVLLRSRLAREYGPQGFLNAAETMASPLVVSWRKGVSAEEIAGEVRYRWVSREGELVIHNTGKTTRQAELTFEVESGRDEPSTLEISGALSERIRLGADPLRVRRVVALAPGAHRLRLRSDAKPVDAPADPRVLVFQIRDFSVGDADRK
jgi:phosphoglycerol transferase